MNSTLRIANGLRCLIGTVLAASLCGATTFAHDGPEHVIETLTAEMAKTGVTAELLYRRACEYRALRKYAAAEADLTAALERDPESFATKFELVNVLAQQRHWDRCLSLVNPLTTAENRSLRAAALTVRGRVRMVQEDWTAARTDFEVALALDATIESYLLRARAQAKLDCRAAQIAGLREGLADTNSPVLLRHLCEALLDAGGESLTEARKIVERELADSRFRSSWLMRRARLHLLAKNRAAAEDDLREAVAELDARLRTPHPDPALQVDRLVAQYVLETPSASPDELRVPETIPEIRPPTQVEPD